MKFKAKRETARKKARISGSSRNPDPSVGGFPIIGIGASAGGLEAFKELFEAIPPDTGMSFVLIQHLAPMSESFAAEILSRSTRMPVHQVEGRVPIHPNCVYVIPPNYRMVLSRGVLSLHPRETDGGHELVINSFFKSLALDQKGRGIGIILSGTASDGTEGLKAIKAEGGLAIVQSPSTAKYKGMPESAISAGVADLILSPKEIAIELTRISKHPYVESFCSDSSHRMSEPVREMDEDLGASSIQAIRKIILLLRTQTGVDFSSYKLTTLRRRIERRMMVRKAKSLEEYAKFIKSSPSEAKALFSDILIHVTEFFRDSDCFQAVQAEVLPRILRNRKGQSTIRIWVAGCSTGEEVYSLAILLIEALRNTEVKIPLQIFGTDICEEAIQKARMGVYSSEIERNVSKERLSLFFQKEGDKYRISKTVRDLCLFSKHDLTSDPPFSKVDLITCRNVLIYYVADLQKRIIPLFHYALKSGGLLWLGKSESPSQASAKLFSVIDKSHKIYLKNNIATPLVFHYPSKIYLPAIEAIGDPAKSRVLVGGISVKNSTRVPTTQFLPTFSAKRSGRKRKIKPTLENQGRRILQLERDLLANEEHQQSMAEEFQSSQEELTSANEELQSTNEEMQSTNEELETAKEELQSINEELNTVNEELQNRNNELIRFSSDLNNIMSAIDIPIVIVGNDLSIRRFTPKAENVFKLRPGDVGRPISDIRSEINLDFYSLIPEVISSLNSKEIEVQDHQGRWMRMLIRPYKTIDNRIDGAVISLIDITALKQKVAFSEDAQDYLISVAESVTVPLAVLDQNLCLKSANRSFWTTFKLPRAILGKPFLSHLESSDNLVEKFGRDLRLLVSSLPHPASSRSVEMQCKFPEIGTQTIRLSAHLIDWLGKRSQEPNAILLTIETITPSSSGP